LPSCLGRLWRGVPLASVAAHTIFVGVVVLLPVGFGIIVQVGWLVGWLVGGMPS
jgi:hypothetical protein